MLGPACLALHAWPCMLGPATQVWWPLHAWPCTWPPGLVPWASHPPGPARALSRRGDDTYHILLPILLALPGTSLWYSQLVVLTACGTHSLWYSQLVVLTASPFAPYAAVGIAPKSYAAPRGWQVFSNSYGEDETAWSEAAATRLNVEFQKVCMALPPMQCHPCSAHTKLASLSHTQLASLSHTQLASLSDTQLASLSDTQLASLSHTQRASLSDTHSLHLSLTHSLHLSLRHTQLASLSHTQLASLTHTQLASLGGPARPTQAVMCPEWQAGARGISILFASGDEACGLWMSHVACG